MKALYINYDYYEYPEGISNLEEFMQYLQDHYHSFIKLKEWQTEKCCYPYFIESEFEWVYRNVAQISSIRETKDDVTVLPLAEYTKRLTQVVADKCVHCAYYYEDCHGDNLQGHYRQIDLDGKCDSFRKAEEK